MTRDALIHRVLKNADGLTLVGELARWANGNPGATAQQLVNMLVGHLHGLPPEPARKAKA